MPDKDIMLLENTAIRYITPMDHRTYTELISKGLMDEGCYYDLEDIKRIGVKLDGSGLSDRSAMIIREVIKCSDKVRKAVDDYADIAERDGIKTVCKDDPDYPFSWKMLTGMPPVFFAKGDTSILRQITYTGAAAIVGSRKPGRYSLYATEQFSSALARKDVVIVSGLALGIDRKAHEACLNEGKKTVAVTAGGANIIYPYQNRDIYERIMSEGVLITELPPGQEVLRQYFPSRNRLISALSDSVLIMEAGLYSGTLHTASFAAAQGKDVFVLPNSIYSENSIGGLMLLRDGAEVLIDADTVYERIMGETENRRLLLDEPSMLPGDMFDKNRLRQMAKTSPDELNEEQWKLIVYDEISERPKNIDELCISLGIPFSFLSAIVTGLETEGKIANERGRYVLTIHGR